MHSASKHDDACLPQCLPDGSPLPTMSLIHIGTNKKTQHYVDSKKYTHAEHLYVEEYDTSNPTESDYFKNCLKITQKSQADILFFLPNSACLFPLSLYAAALAFYETNADIILYPYMIQMLEYAETIMPLHPEGRANDSIHVIIKNNAFPQSPIPYMLIRRDTWLRANKSLNAEFSATWNALCEMGAKVHTIGSPLITLPDDFLYENRRRTSGPFEKSKNRIALVNDLGFSYGAGIAHRRLYKAVAMSGANLDIVALGQGLSRKDFLRSQKIILNRLEAFAPDLVICGNLHSSYCNNNLLENMLENWPVVFCLHDLWILTGHCTHPGLEKCEKLITGCDHTCPCPDSYPFVAHHEIASLWQRNRRALHHNNLLTLSNSRWVIGEYERYAPSAPKTYLLQLGCEDDIFKPVSKDVARSIRSKWSLDLDDFIVFMAMCDFTAPSKGAMEGLTALKNLDIPNLKILCVGQQAWRATKIFNRAIAVDYVEKPEEMAELFQASDIVVSFSHAETLGQTLIEAAFCGVPSLAYAVTGLTDAVADGVSGLLCPEDPEALITQIKQLYSDKKRRQTLGFYAVLHARNTRSLYAEYKSLNDALEESKKFTLHPDKVACFHPVTKEKRIFFGKPEHPIYPYLKKMTKRILPIKVQHVLRILYYKLFR